MTRLTKKSKAKVTNTNDYIGSCLAEYTALKAEQNYKMQTQVRLIGYMVVLLGAILTAVTQLRNYGQISDGQLGFYLLMLPVIIAPLLYAYFDNEKIVIEIGSYLKETASKRLSDEIGKPVLLWDAYLGSRARNFSYYFVEASSKLIVVLPILLPLGAYFLLVPRNARPTCPFPYPVIGFLVADIIILVSVLVIIGIHSRKFIHVSVAKSENGVRS